MWMTTKFDPQTAVTASASSAWRNGRLVDGLLTGRRFRLERAF